MRMLGCLRQESQTMCGLACKTMSFLLPANLTLANFDKFWADIIFDLSGNQTDARSITIEHLKRAVSYEDPADNLGWMRDCYRMLKVAPEITVVPTEYELKIIYFGIYPKGLA